MARKGNMNDLEAKAKVQTTQSIYNVMQSVEKVPKGVVQKQAKGKWQ